MKRNMYKTLAATALTLIMTAGFSAAMDHSKMDHSQMNMGSTPAGETTSMDHSKHMGDAIHESKLDKGMFAYHLIDNAKQMEKAMAGGMKMDHSKMEMKSNHLMVYAADLAGKNIDGAKVGYQVTGPDGKVQQVMAMEMTGGYGADVDLKAKGKYEVKTKLVKGDLQLLDTFTYEVK